MKTRTMALANKAISVVYIQQNQSPAEQRFGLNLLISMLNQNKNSASETLLPDAVIKLAELLIATGTTRFLTAEQLLKLLAAYSMDDVPPDYIKAMMAKVSDSVFDESPVKQATSSSKSRLTASGAKSRQPVEKSNVGGTNSDQEVKRSPSGKLIQTKAPKDEDFKDFMSQLMSTSTRPTGLVISLVDPKTAADDQGRAISSIFQAIDAKTQSLIEIPMTRLSDEGHVLQNELKGAQASIALACLKKHILRQEHSSIKRQVQVIHAFIQKYSQSQVLKLFKKEFLAELAIYKNLWIFFSKPMDKTETERDFCKMLLKEVAKSDLEFANQLQRELDLKDASSTVEGLLTKLEENHRLLESQEAESPAK